jgi:hypothetical protein
MGSCWYAIFGRRSRRDDVFSASCQELDRSRFGTIPVDTRGRCTPVAQSELGSCNWGGRISKILGELQLDLHVEGLRDDNDLYNKSV